VGTARVGAGGICGTRPAGAGGGAGLSVQDDRQVDAADHAIHPAVPADGEVRAVAYRGRRFARVYTEADVRLLAQVDRAHERLSGPAL